MRLVYHDTKRGARTRLPLDTPYSACYSTRAFTPEYKRISCALLASGGRSESPGQARCNIIMHHYELLFILPGTFAEDELAPHVAKVKETMEQSGVTECAIEGMGKSRLSYPMQHIRYGYFYLAYFQAEPKAVVAMQAKLTLMRELLRLMVRKYNPNKQIQRRIIPPTSQVVERETPAKPAAELVQEKGVRMEKPEAVPAAPKETKVEDIKLEDIDKKLDQLLETDIAEM